MGHRRSLAASTHVLLLQLDVLDSQENSALLEIENERNTIDSMQSDRRSFLHLKHRRTDQHFRNGFLLVLLLVILPVKTRVELH